MSFLFARMAGPLLLAAPPLIAYLLIKPALHVVIVSAAAVALYLHCLKPEPRREMAGRAMLTITLLPVIAWSLHTPWLLYTLLMLWVPLVAGGAGRIVPVYLLSLLVLPGLDSVAGIGSLKLFDFGVHDALAVGAAVALLINRRRNRPGWRVDLPACALIVLLAAALSRETSISHFLRTVSNVMMDLGIPYFIASRGLRDGQECRRAMLWLGCAAVMMGAILLYELVRAWPIYNELYGQYGLTPLLVKARGGMLRAGASFVEPTSAAMVLALAMVALWACRRDFRSRRLHGLLLLIALAGLFAPQSRGAWLGLGFALVIGELYMGRIRPLMKGGLLALSAGVLLLGAALSSPQLSETLGLSGESSGTSDYRRQLFQRGMEEFRHSPIVGFSVPELNVRMNDLRQGEGIIDFVNAYVWIMLISGGVGFIIFTGTFLHYFWGLRRYRSWLKDDPDGRECAAFLFAGLAAMMQMLIFTSFGTRPAVFVFILFGFTAAFTTLYKRPAWAPRPVPFTAKAASAAR